MLSPHMVPSASSCICTVQAAIPARVVFCSVNLMWAVVNSTRAFLGISYTLEVTCCPKSKDKILVPQNSVVKFPLPCTYSPGY